jgi:hypothetical protein
MSDQWRTEWSRHYDQIQWTATTIFTGVVGVLLAYSYQQDKDKFDLAIAFLGLCLTWLTIYYVASCREFRRVLHDSLPDGEEKDFLQNRTKAPNQKRLLWQWPAFLLTFILLTIGWLWQFWRRDKQGWAIAFAVVSLVGVPYIWKRGKPFEKEAQPSAALNDGTATPLGNSGATGKGVIGELIARQKMEPWTADSLLGSHLEHRRSILLAYHDHRADVHRYVYNALLDAAMVTCRSLWELIGVTVPSRKEQNTGNPAVAPEFDSWRKTIAPILPAGIEVLPFDRAQFDALPEKQEIILVLVAANKCVAHLDAYPDHGVGEPQILPVIDVTLREIQRRIRRKA